MLNSFLSIDIPCVPQCLPLDHGCRINPFETIRKVWIDLTKHRPHLLREDAPIARSDTEVICQFVRGHFKALEELSIVFDSSSKVFTNDTSDSVSIYGPLLPKLLDFGNVSAFKILYKKDLNRFAVRERARSKMAYVVSEMVKEDVALQGDYKHCSAQESHARTIAELRLLVARKVILNLSGIGYYGLAKQMRAEIETAESLLRILDDDSIEKDAQFWSAHSTKW